VARLLLRFRSRLFPRLGHGRKKRGKTLQKPLRKTRELRKTEKNERKKKIEGTEASTKRDEEKLSMSQVKSPLKNMKR